MNTNYIVNSFVNYTRDKENLEDSFSEILLDSYKENPEETIDAYASVFLSFARCSHSNAKYEIEERLRYYVHTRFSHSYRDLSWERWNGLEWGGEESDRLESHNNYYRRDFLEFPDKKPLLEDITERFEEDFMEDITEDISDFFYEEEDLEEYFEEE